VSRLAVVVHDLAQARATLAAEGEHAIEIVLMSAPGAAKYAGVGFLRALGELAGREILVDCGEDAGLVLAGLRTGLRRLVFRGRPDILARLQDIAAQLGAAVQPGVEPPLLELAPEDEAGRAVRAWLQRPGRHTPI
jgi:hypothetical protein